MPNFEWGPRDISAPVRKALRQVGAEKGLVLEDVQTGWVGAVLRTEKSGGLYLMVLEDARGRTKSFELGFGFLLEGEPVEVVPAVKSSAPTVQRTASGSVAVANQRARTARASRIWVEGKHDAELVEKVWGDDLRVEGIVVEPLHGVDDLAAAVRDFSPGPGRRLGILVDHLVPGSKESRIAAAAMAVPGAAANVLIVGHPYVDVWQAIKPHVIGLQAWPVVPRSEDWKTGILKGLGWPHRDHTDVAMGWKKLLGAVRTYADLEPTLLGRVEEVIDFLTVP
ncbi:DUF3097 domain-containing protein [Arthrobacter caoxuetaonis]|uniref:DUF3097 domain-containing protein n=1 Tax=Arthrobacter caoxuetaonis TaxID=2886935 RepID=A0A9X1SEQ3_9MICC|nr:DUF3097 domain-containing protein [Arthrobacter caoxuetaonis]MCC3297899.1 DUF3097 domain-containing protein [Arthrobacter caoxuetaonis]USQ55916.1 DUF3097 domain-containing protein [Arthrobacter caoxuetaonis]